MGHSASLFVFMDQSIGTLKSVRPVFSGSRKEPWRWEIDFHRSTENHPQKCLVDRGPMPQKNWILTGMNSYGHKRGEILVTAGKRTVMDVISILKQFS